MKTPHYHSLKLNYLGCSTTNKSGVLDLLLCS